MPVEQPVMRIVRAIGPLRAGKMRAPRRTSFRRPDLYGRTPPAGSPAVDGSSGQAEQGLSETLSIVVAIFGLIGLGYAAARSGLLAASVREGLTEFVLKVAIPLLLFDTLATADLQGLSPWRLWAAYFVPFAAVWALSHLMIRRVFGREARAGVVAGGSAAYSNSVLDRHSRWCRPPSATPASST